MSSMDDAIGLVLGLAVVCVFVLSDNTAAWRGVAALYLIYQGARYLAKRN